MEQTVMSSPNIQTLTGVIASCAPSSYSTLPPAIRYVIESGSSSDNAEINALKNRVTAIENDYIKQNDLMTVKNDLQTQIDALTARVAALENNTNDSVIQLLNLYTNSSNVRENTITLPTSYSNSTFILLLAKVTNEDYTAISCYNLSDFSDTIKVNLGNGSLDYTFNNSTNELNYSNNSTGQSNVYISKIIGIVI